MKIQTPSFEIPTPPASARTNAAAPAAAQPATEAGGFGQAVADAIDGAEQAQQAGDVEAGKLARGEGNLHEAALALEKADISMRLMVKARNKIVEAYQDIMRMPV